MLSKSYPGELSLDNEAESAWNDKFSEKIFFFYEDHQRNGVPFGNVKERVVMGVFCESLRGQ